MSSRSSSSLSLAKIQYAFVRPTNKKTSAPKKILIPKKMNDLKKNVLKAFGKEVQTCIIQNENGETITDIRDVSAGIKLYVTFKNSKKQQNQPHYLSDADSRTSCNDSLVSLSSKIDLDSNSVQSEIPNYTVNETESMQSINTNNSEDEISVKEASNIIPLPNTDEKVLSESSSYSSDEEANPDIQNEPESKASQYSNDDSNGSQKLSEDYDEEEDEVNEVPFSNNIFTELIKTCIEVDDYNSIEEACSKLSPQSHEMLSEMIMLENEQKVRYYKEMIKILEIQGLNPFLDKLIGSDQLKQKARDFISQHRITNPIVSSYIFRAAILGPMKCGKSTFLGVLSQQLLLDLMATNTWKKAFVYVADLDKIMSGYQDNKAFYKSFINHLFSLFTAQLPSMIQFLPKIEKAFLSITEYSSKADSFPLPTKLTQSFEYRKLSSDLKSIGSSMASIWYDPSALSQWITSLVLLPSFLAKIFGFHNIVYILDNFEAAQVQLDPLYPFEESESIPSFDEFWKYAIVNHPYLLSTGDEQQFMYSLASTNETSIDLLSQTELISLFDLINLVEDDKVSKYSDAEVTVTFEDKNEVPLKLTSGSCGGIPLYINQWNKINKILDDLEMCDDNSAQYEDLYCQVLGETETLLFLLIVRQQDNINDSIEDQRFGVYDVHRNPQKKP